MATLHERLSIEIPQMNAPVFPLRDDGSCISLGGLEGTQHPTAAVGTDELFRHSRRERHIEAVERNTQAGSKSLDVGFFPRPAEKEPFLLLFRRQ